MNESARGPYQVERALSSLADFHAFHAEHPEMFADITEETIIEHCRRNGIHSEIMGFIPPVEVAVIGPEAREHLFARGLNSRHRAVVEAIVAYLRRHAIADSEAKIYGHEAISNFALVLRGRFPKFIGTEYARNEEERRELFPIPHGDICNSDLPDGVFNLIISCDVFEHVPDIDAALRESVRILKKGGRFIGTFPFLFDRQTSVRLARLERGELVIDGEPIYHGNPMDIAGGSLVFELPAWDVLNRAKAAGFSDTTMCFVCDQLKGIVGSHLDNSVRPRGVFVALFDK